MRFKTEPVTAEQFEAILGTVNTAAYIQNLNATDAQLARIIEDSWPTTPLPHKATLNYNFSELSIKAYSELIQTLEDAFEFTLIIKSIIRYTTAAQPAFKQFISESNSIPIILTRHLLDEVDDEYVLNVFSELDTSMHTRSLKAFYTESNYMEKNLTPAMLDLVNKSQDKIIRQEPKKNVLKKKHQEAIIEYYAKISNLENMPMDWKKKIFI